MKQGAYVMFWYLAPMLHYKMMDKFFPVTSHRMAVNDGSTRNEIP